MYINCFKFWLVVSLAVLNLHIESMFYQVLCFCSHSCTQIFEHFYHFFALFVV
jgi:hypothetical protein